MAKGPQPRGLYLCTKVELGGTPLEGRHHRLVVESPTVAAIRAVFDHHDGIKTVALADWGGLLGLAVDSELADCRYYGGLSAFFERLVLGISILVEGELGYNPGIWSVHPRFFAENYTDRTSDFEVWTRARGAQLLQQLDEQPWLFLNQLTDEGFGQ